MARVWPLGRVLKEIVTLRVEPQAPSEARSASWMRVARYEFNACATLGQGVARAAQAEGGSCSGSAPHPIIPKALDRVDPFLSEGIVEDGTSISNVRRAIQQSTPVDAVCRSAHVVVVVPIGCLVYRGRLKSARAIRLGRVEPHRRPIVISRWNHDICAGYYVEGRLVPLQAIPRQREAHGTKSAVVPHHVCVVHGIKPDATTDCDARVHQRDKITWRDE